MDEEIIEESIILIKSPKEKSGKFETAKVLSLASAHGLHDTYAGFLAPLLPLMIERLSLLNVQAGLFMVFMQWPSILQPIIGHFADRVNFKQLVILAPAVTAFCMSLFPTVNHYWIAALLLIISGLASATLHAVAPAVISNLSGKQLGRGMSFWMISGEIGVMVGPILITSVVVSFSTNAAPWLMVFGIAASVFLYFLFKNIDFISPGQVAQPIKRSMDGIYKVFLPLAGILIMRAMLRAAVEIYMPVYLTERGASLWLAGASLTILEGAGILGILISGIFTDKFGSKPILLIGLLGSFIMMYLFLNSSGWQELVFLILLGLISLYIVPIGMTIMQESFPNNRSFANGLYLAILFIVNSLAGVIMGWMSDSFGFQQAFTISMYICLLGIPFVFMLPQKATNSVKIERENP